MALEQARLGNDWSACYSEANPLVMRETTKATIDWAFGSVTNQDDSSIMQCMTNMEARLG